MGLNVLGYPFPAGIIDPVAETGWGRGPGLVYRLP